MDDNATQQSGRGRWACLTDWDGTVTALDTQVLLLDAYGRPDWRAPEDELYARGGGSREAYPLIYDGFRIPEAEVATFVRQHVRLDPAFSGFARFCREKRVPLRVVSDGQHFYIDLMLLEAGLSWVPVEANRAEFTSEGVVLKFNDPPRGCGRCGNCKRHWVREYHRQGYRVLYAGDGRTDRCAAREADFVFARGFLAGFCREEELPWAPLDGFGQLEAFLRRQDRPGEGPEEGGTDRVAE